MGNAASWPGALGMSGRLKTYRQDQFAAYRLVGGNSRQRRRFRRELAAQGYEILRWHRLSANRGYWV